MKYVVFIRKLCQENITYDDIEYAQELIDEFHVEYELLYGVSFMSSNLHGHLHLPKQVFDYGPLNKTSCYIFENIFKMSRGMFHGESKYPFLNWELVS